ncbi:glycosyltransferase [Methanococcoides sp. SA1]|nr:glycosyltransferase [Methanococcoides sp. SA1]
MRTKYDSFNPFVTIVVCTYNSASYVSNTVESLLKLDYPMDKMEILLIDDASPDNTFDVCYKYVGHGNVKVFRNEENLGLSGSLNKGLALSDTKSEIFLQTDHDCVVKPDWVKTHVRHYKNDDIDGVGGYFDTPEDADRFSRLFSDALKLPNPDVGKNGNVDSIAGGNSSYRKKSLELVGGWDDRFRYGGGDADLNLRLRKRNKKLVIDKECRVDHFHPRSTLSQLWRKFSNDPSTVMVWKKHYGKLNRNHYFWIAKHFMGSIVQFIPCYILLALYQLINKHTKIDVAQLPVFRQLLILSMRSVYYMFYAIGITRTLNTGLEIEPMVK